MIGQDIGSMFLVPLALEKLTIDPLCEGNLYPGDLLCSLLRLPKDFWNLHSDLRSQLEAVLSKLSQVDESTGEELEIPETLFEALRSFRIEA